MPRTFTIAKALLTVAPSPSSATRQYSDPNPAFAAAIGGFVNGDSSSALTAQPGCSSGANGASAPGGYGVGCSGGAAANYVFSYVGGTLAVTQEDARAAYDGRPSFKTASASSGSAAVALSAAIRDISAVSGDPAFDSFPGDIRNATVMFVNRDELFSDQYKKHLGNDMRRAFGYEGCPIVLVAKPRPKTIDPVRKFKERSQQTKKHERRGPRERVARRHA